jgi:peptide/nickel transport system substrate-binding protein
LSALALVGCGDDDDDDDDGEATETAEATSTAATSTATAEGTATGTGTGTSTATATSAEEADDDLNAYRKHRVFDGEGPAVRGGTLTLSTNEPDSFDVYAGAGGYAIGIAQSIYNHPWRAHLPTGEPEPFFEGDLVSEWEQPDENTWVLTMREGVNWQDLDPVNGRAFVAEDVAANLTRMNTQAPGYSMATRLQMIKDVAATDEKTVTIGLNWPYNFFIYNLADQASTIIAPELFENDLAKTNPVGTGPFMLDEWQRGTAVILKANPNYFDTGLPYFDEIQYVIQTDFATNVANFIAGKLDAFSLLTWESEQSIRDQNPEAVLWETIAYPFVAALNTTSTDTPALTDKRVRQAIKLATDYEACIDPGFSGHGNRGQPLATIHAKYQLPADKLPVRDVQAAKDLLSAAGYPDGFDMIDSISNLVIPDQGHTQWVNALADVGINVELQVSPFNEWITNAFFEGNTDSVTTGLFSFLPPDVQLALKWESTGAYNNSHFNSPEFDQKLQQAREELDDEAAVALYQELGEMLFDESPDIYLLEIKQLVGKQGRVENWVFQDGWWSAANMWWDVAWLSS